MQKMATSTNTRNRQLITQSIFLVVFVAGVLWLCSALGVFSKREPAPHTVTYKVDGSTTAGVITYTQADGGTTRPENVSVPWQLAVKFSKSTTVILTAGNPNQTGSIRCTLLLDGEVWKQDSTDSPGDKVSCAGILP
jgi:hypothetical protein